MDNMYGDDEEEDGMVNDDAVAMEWILCINGADLDCGQFLLPVLICNNISEHYFFLNRYNIEDVWWWWWWWWEGKWWCSC